MGVLVSTSFDGKALGMMQQLSKDHANIWELYPVALTEAEVKSCGLREIMPLILNPDDESRLPSRLAGIKKDEIESELLIAIDRTYRKSVESYPKHLFHATREDCKLLLDQKSKFRIAEDFHWLWRLISFWGKPFISKQEFQRNTQAHRHDWFVRIHTLESQRIARIKCEIEVTVPKLEKQLSDLTQTDKRRGKIQKEIEQLQRVYKAVVNHDLNMQTQTLQK